MSSWRDKRTKVVVRHLPPEWNEETFRQVAGEWMDRCSWFRFVEGKDAMRLVDSLNRRGLQKRTHAQGADDHHVTGM
jgi:hypothetical protein